MVQWMYFPTNNVTLRIDSIGVSGQGVSDQYTVDPTYISECTFREIVAIVCNTVNKNRKNSSTNNTGEKKEKREKRKIQSVPVPSSVLRFSKVTGNIVKSQLRQLLLCGAAICPDCGTANCIICKHKHVPQHITCTGCGVTYIPRKSISLDRKLFFPCTSWQCFKCKYHLAEIYKEFLEYLADIDNNQQGNNQLGNHQQGTDIHIKVAGSMTQKIVTPKAAAIYQFLSPKARDDLNNDPCNLSYSLKIRETGITIPPITFLADYQRSIHFYQRFLSPDVPQAPGNVKTTFGTVLERMERGKNTAVRQFSHNTRYVKSGRAIIVPYNRLEPDECILPISMWRRLECPRIILAHRYPTLNDRNFTVHSVIGTWIYPVLGIPTSIVHGHNADFDGDAMQIIPLTNPMSEIEARILFHPSYNMIVAAPRGQKRLRLMFDHDEILTLYNLFGINGDDMHAALYDLAQAESSENAYNCFCRLRHLCQRVWECHVVYPITYGHVLELFTAGNRSASSYNRFVETYYPLISDTNTIKRIVSSRSSRFSLDHVWQLIGIINIHAPSSNFLGGMTRRDFVNLAKMSRLALIRDIAYAGYGYLKLLYCTRTLVLAYDGRIYTLDGELVVDNIDHIV